MILETLLAADKRAVEPSWDHFFSGVPGNANVASTGRSVSVSAATGVSAVYACVRVISETVSSLPLGVFRRDGRDKSEVRQHPTAKLLRRPNGAVSSITFWEHMMYSVLLWGNAYALIEFEGARPVRLSRIDPNRIAPLAPLAKEIGDTIVYAYQRRDGARIELPGNEVLHVMGLSEDGLSGVPVIAKHRETVALSMATLEYGARFFGNSARPAGVVERPADAAAMSPEGLKRFRESFAEVYQGLDNAHRTAILEEGMTFKALSMPNEDAQFLETRRFQVEEIARMFRVPLHLIQDLSRATFSNVEQQAIDFVVHTIRPWLKKIEHEVNRKLFRDSEQDDMFVSFNVDALLRGDSKTRAEVYTAGINGGWWSINDIRAMENQNGIGPEGDKHLRPLNMTTVEDGPVDASPPDEPSPPDDTPADDTPDDSGNGRQIAPDGHDVLLGAFRHLFDEAAERLVLKEVKAVASCAKRLKGDKLQARLIEFYDDHAPFIRLSFLPACRAMIDAHHAASGLDMLDELPTWVDDDLTAVASKYGKHALRRVARDGPSAIESAEAESMEHLASQAYHAIRTHLEGVSDA